MKKPVYDKANSILEIRGIDEKRNEIFQHLMSSYEKIDDLSKDDPLRNALSDLF